MHKNQLCMLILFLLFISNLSNDAMIPLIFIIIYLLYILRINQLHPPHQRPHPRPQLQQPRLQPPPPQPRQQTISGFNHVKPMHNNMINDLYDEFVEPGDNALSLRMLEMGKKAKQSIDNRAKFDKNSIQPYIEEELRMFSNSRWWEDDSLEYKF